MLASTLYMIYINDLPDPLYVDSVTLQYASNAIQILRDRTKTLFTKQVQEETDHVRLWELK